MRDKTPNDWTTIFSKEFSTDELPSPIEVAGRLARDGQWEAAMTIRSLLSKIEELEKRFLDARAEAVDEAIVVLGHLRRGSLRVQTEVT